MENKEIIQTDGLPTQDEIYQLEKMLQEKKRKIADYNNKQQQKREKEWKEKTQVSVYGSDDYYGAGVLEYSFYFGYEETMCKKHPKRDDCEDRFDCEEREWCFVASKGDKEIMRLPASELKDGCNIDESFVSGLMLFIKNYH